MAKLYVDCDKFGYQAASPTVEAFHSTIKDIVRTKLAKCGGDWDSFVFDKSYDLISANAMPGDAQATAMAVMDDSGGTLTAPIIESFKGVICAGGSTRSHLGILTREYGVPCLMNAKISGIRNGDTVEIEVTAAAKTAEAYQKGVEMTANIWRLKRA